MTSRLILAVEPDDQQAAQLRELADRLSSELVRVSSTAAALDRLGERLPDLILTPALLSRRDDLLLADRLRALGGAAVHIQTLTIPRFEAVEVPSRGGILGSLRRDRPAIATTAGCDVGGFAEQVAVYLRRAAQLRGEATEPARPLEREAAETGDIAVVMCEVVPEDEDVAVAPAAAPDARHDDPAEDEWSVFDPSEARFVSLIERLDQLAEEGGPSGAPDLRDVLGGHRAAAEVKSAVARTIDPDT